MIFLGSVRLDGSKRLTLIKEVAEVLQVGEKDYITFYINDGEILIRKVMPQSGKFNNGEAEYQDWLRKRKLEIEMMEDPDEIKKARESLLLNEVARQEDGEREKQLEEQ